MKLSFSTNHWGENSLNRCLDIAVTYGFSGVELHSLDDLGGETPAAVYHRLIALGMKIPCVDLCAAVGIAAPQAEALGVSAPARGGKRRRRRRSGGLFASGCAAG